MIYDNLEYSNILKSIVNQQTKEALGHIYDEVVSVDYSTTNIETQK